jgi:CRISPR-associated endonuclease/helicase Cas3
MTFWAHSDPGNLPPDASGSHWQLLAEHLKNVSVLSRRLAEFAAPEYKHFHDLAEWSGLLHDYGKYTDCFQRMILEKKGKCPHAIHGAAMAFGGSAADPIGLRAPHIASVIAGHHAGMPDRTELFDRAKKGRAEALGLLERAVRDLPTLGKLFENAPPKLENVGQRFDLLTRMLLSCLVDADRLDTAGRKLRDAPLMAAHRLEILLQYLNQLTQHSPEGEVKSARREVLEDCLAAASFPDRIFSLSVPTGGGKTLAAMAFALKRASLYPDRCRRVIVVIPYLSIIEQNADVYAKVFGADSVLEHHSGSFARLVDENKHFKPRGEEAGEYQQPLHRPETENWDAPLIVTTSVRLFESLFSNHPSDLRRVHNIARSIVILDEVQVLPRPLLAPLLGMMDELSTDWGCTFVLSTATKPAFERRAVAGAQDLRWNPGTVREIARAPAVLHRRLRRVTIDWRINNAVDWPEVAAWMLEHKQALCVVNVRDHASKLFDELGARCPGDSLFHLSTRMCPAHRLEIIAAIRPRLKGGFPCLVVSTQLIEAGVDLDFPVAFRALGPLDSIVQVAGRADREGKITASLGKPGGLVVVFKPADHRMPPNEYAMAAGATETLACSRDIQCDDLDAMEQFFEAYYGNADLGSDFLEMRRQAKFRSLADAFEMISSRTQDVFVPFGDGKRLIDELFKVRRLNADLRRRLQRYTVGLFPGEFQKARNTILCGLDDVDGIWIASDAAYSDRKGLQICLGSEDLVI